MGGLLLSKCAPQLSSALGSYSLLRSISLVFLAL